MKRLIIFSHHYVNDDIKQRFDFVKKLNSDWNIIPVGFSNYELLPNSFVIKKDKYPNNYDLKFQADNDYPYKRHIDWFDADLFLYETYFQYSFRLFFKVQLD